jgi:hypothetical protein
MGQFVGIQILVVFEYLGDVIAWAMGDLSFWIGSFDSDNCCDCGVVAGELRNVTSKETPADGEFAVAQ